MEHSQLTHSHRINHHQEQKDAEWKKTFHMQDTTRQVYTNLYLNRNALGRLLNCV